MLSLFPQILFLAPFSALLLRIAVACTLLCVVFRMVGSRDQMIGLEFPIIGPLPPWVVWWSSTVTTVAALLLLVGYLTQLAAILGMVVALKLLIFEPRIRAVLPLSRTAFALLFVTCLSLLLTGAGTFAFDLPL